MNQLYSKIKLKLKKQTKNIQKENKLQGYIVQLGKYSKYFITINGVKPLKIMNHDIVPVIYNVTNQSYFSKNKFKEK